ncbi:sensor histidine kinase [Pedobacter sp. PWIIR3]
MANLALKQQASTTFKNYRWVLHVLFWLCAFLAYFFSHYLSGFFEVKSYPKFVLEGIFITKFSMYVLACYSFLFIVVPLYKQPQRYIYWFSFFGVLLFWYLVQVSLFCLIYKSAPFQPINVDNSFLGIANRHYSNYLVFFSIFIAFYYFVDIYDQQKGLRQLEQYKTQKIALEASFLKSQVNPHFLFNTLNNIYALSLKKSDQTQIIIERLESLLHYMLYECKAELVPLENEFTFTDSYIALEKLRHKDDRCTVTVNVNGDIKNKYIAPLLLINFLENAFKHGTKASFGKSWINLDVDVSDDLMHFKLQNSKPFNMVGQAISEYKGGIGLRNVRRRLEILYPLRHQLHINNLKDRFEIDLSINI